MKLFSGKISYSLLFTLLLCFPLMTNSQNQSIDKKVKSFLDNADFGMRNMNISSIDGQFMYDIIIKHKYTKALEIGTSTGHSAIWIAWALSKTGGKLITLEIDEERHKQALKNFKEAGVADFIDARLVNAHDFVKETKEKFDFVFSDADKDWYKQYFIDVAPKMIAGGCYVTHNISDRGRGQNSGYLEYLKTRTDFETTYERSKTTGVSVSYKK